MKKVGNLKNLLSFWPGKTNMAVSLMRSQENTISGFKIMFGYLSDRFSILFNPIQSSTGYFTDTLCEKLWNECFISAGVFCIFLSNLSAFHIFISGYFANIVVQDTRRVYLWQWKNRTFLYCLPGFTPVTYKHVCNGYHHNVMAIIIM